MTARGVRHGLLKAARAAGLLSLSANSPGRRSRLLILCYHGIALDDEERWLPHLYISPARFRRRLELLRLAGANVLDLSEGIQRMQQGTLPPRSVVITFDDGFVDFHVHAVPLLKEFNYPATLYLTTYYCLHRYPVFNLMVDYLLWKSGRKSIELPEFGLKGAAPIGNYVERQAVLIALLDWAGSKGLSGAEKDGVARSLAGAVGLDYDRLLDGRILQLMTPEEVGAAARSGISMELHTHRHRTPRDRDLFQREIRDNALYIQEFTGREPAHFCYPSGDYDRQFFSWMKELGVQTATTCEAGLAAAGSERYLLPRLLDDSIAPEIDFERWLAGFLM